MDVALPQGIPPWRGSFYDTLSETYAAGTEALFGHAVEPTASALAALLATTPRGADNASMDRWEDLKLVQLEAHKSFALSLNALWERNFRTHLWHSAALAGWEEPGVTQTGNYAKWFEDIRGFSLSKFRSYPEIRLLSLVGNAVRHGNGPSTRKLYAADPSLFVDDEVTTGWFSYFAHGGEPEASVRKLYIPIERLEAFKSGIVDFWVTIRALQKASGD